MTKGLRMFYVGPDDHALQRGDYVEIMASSHTEAMKKGMMLHAQGLLATCDPPTVELYVTDGVSSHTFAFEASPVDCPYWLERTEEPTDHPSLF